MLEPSLEAVNEAVLLDRAQVRVRASARFGVDRMVDAYLRVYSEMAR